jgi:hypothetical protein
VYVTPLAGCTVTGAGTTSFIEATAAFATGATRVQVTPAAVTRRPTAR